MDPITLNSRLDSVTVYARGALCSRYVDVGLTEGRLPGRIRVVDLPISLHATSLRARLVSGPDGLRVRDIRPGYEALLASEAEVPASQQALEQAEGVLADLEARSRALNLEIASLQSLAPIYPPQRKGDPPRESPVPALLKLGEFVESELEALQSTAWNLQPLLEDARHAVVLLRRRMTEGSNAQRVERAQLLRTAELSLDVPEGAGPAQLALEYFVPGVRWAPSYELKLSRSMDAGSLRIRASVAQQTGEDWKNVRLRLSTAELDRRTDVPELRALRIGRSQPAPRPSGWREPPAGLDDLFADFDRFARPPPSFGHRRAAPVSAPKVLPPPPLPPPAPDMAAKPPPPPGGPRGGGRPLDVGAEPVLSSAPVPEAPRMSRARMMKKTAGPEEDVQKDLAESESEGAVLGGAPMEPSEPEAALMDYERLVLSGPEAGGHRGKLQRGAEGANEWTLASVVSVQVNVWMAVVSQRRAAADSVDALRMPALAVPVRESAGSFDYRYDAEHPVDVPSDGAWHSVPLMDAKVELTPEYVCVPSMEKKVYRTVLVRNRSPHALLAGPADVTLGDQFLMTIPFPTIAPLGEARAGLGVEEAIQVARNTRYREAMGGMLTSTALHHELDIELVNQLPHLARVEVRERIPSSVDDHIKVEELSVQPAWTAERRELDGIQMEGLRLWHVQLPPGARVSLNAVYVIKVPADKMLVGGNRRI